MGYHACKLLEEKGMIAEENFAFASRFAIMHNEVASKMGSQGEICTKSEGYRLL